VLGKASLETGAPMTEDSIVRIYSMTKPITSVAFMMLVEEGLVALEDPVTRFIPEWRDLGVYVSGLPGAFQTRPTDSPMRMIDLLRHTSGLTYGFQNRTNVDSAYRKGRLDPTERTGGLDDFITALGKMPLEFSPGSAWNYSVATDVLGYLVGKISGMPFQDFLQQRILGPLGMVDTAFHVTDDKAARFAQCYVQSAEGRLTPQVVGPSFREPPSAPSGGGGLVSTAADYMRFCEALRLGGVSGTGSNPMRLLGPKTLALMRSNHLPGGRDLADMSVSMFSEATYRGVGFGLGFAMTTDVARTGISGSLGEYWWGGAASTAFWIDPVEDLCVVLLTQFRPSSLYPIRRELRTMVSAAVIDSKA
jgi:CubicO group peptidase (beta-lactamase class C family)